MITTLLMFLCVAHGTPKPCDSVDVYSVGSWEGPSAPQECDEARRRVLAELTPKNRTLTRFQCESVSTESEDEASAGQRVTFRL
ncbi:hypothetical protein D3C81_1330490 [compost metagenome]